MNILELPKDNVEELKNNLIDNGTIVEKKRINKCDAKFFETVTISNVLIKFFLFFSIGVYAVVNLICVVLSIIYNSFNSGKQLGVIVGIFVIAFIVLAIFKNINTNKRKEESVIYVKDDNFIFNFNDGVNDTPTLYYTLRYDAITKIEFLIYKLSKNQIFGSVTFTFNVSDYEVNHIIKYTNLSEIEELLKSKFPSLLNNLFIDGKSKDYRERIEGPKKLKHIATSLVLLIMSILLTAIPYAFGYRNIALIVTSVILFITAMLVFISCHIYLFSLIQGTIVSAVFIIIGFCLPLFIIQNSSVSFIDYVIQDNEILMPTIFGIIGLCLYAHSAILIINKIRYNLIKQN